MRVEAVTTCVGYGDFLAESLPRNKQLFDRFVVVTSPEDHVTRRLCEVEHVMCVVTDKFRTADGLFCKGAAINEGLKHLDMSDWVVHIDADVVLPPTTRRYLDSDYLNGDCVYGCDRFIVEDADVWHEHTRRPKIQHEDNVYVHADGYRVGTRICPPAHGGYVPIGFFQLWNPSMSGVTVYPEQHDGAGRTDMLFALNWPPAKRLFLPQIIAYHLESDPDAPQGANWEGRVTRPFNRSSRFHRWCRRWRRRHHDRRRHYDPDPPPTPEPPPYPRPEPEDDD